MKILGYVFIALGILGGIILLASFDFKEYDLAKRVLEQIPDNELAQSGYAAQQKLLIAQITQSVIIIFSFVTVGIFLLGIDRIINLLISIDQRLKGERRSERQAEETG